MIGIKDKKVIIMDRKFNISVAMATYNGEKYIKEQIESILYNLLLEDELIISDDGSTDKTKEIIQSFNDKRIKLIDGPHKGIKQNFANAIEQCNGKYIFLSDQDDVWSNNKVEEVLKCFESDRKITCVIHDCDVVNDDMSSVIYDSFFEYRKCKNGIIYNIYKNRYLGCCMAFTKEMKKFILPIPNNIEMHDQWIGVICDKYGKSYFLPKKLFHYRRHGGNVTKLHHYPLVKMIRNRIVFIKELFLGVKK